MPDSSRHPRWYLTNGRWVRGTVDAGTRPAWHAGSVGFIAKTGRWPQATATYPIGSQTRS